MCSRWARRVPSYPEFFQDLNEVLDRKADPSYVGLMVRRPRGVTTTEYALIVAVFAALAYGSYRVLGSSLSSLANGVDSTLTTASRRAAAATPTPKP
jgi:Flp pilus assembly pilin Flp